MRMTIQTLTETIQIQAKHAERNMNGNISTPDDTTVISLKDDLTCNTYYKTNYFLNSNCKHS